MSAPLITAEKPSDTQFAIIAVKVDGRTITGVGDVINAIAAMGVRQQFEVLSCVPVARLSAP